MSSEKKKMNGMVKLIILMVILAVLTALFFALRAYNKNAEEKEEVKAAGSEMMSIDSDNVKTFGYLINGQAYRFTMGEEGWIYENDPSAQIDQTLIDDMIKSVSSVTTNTIVSDNLDDAADYGLDNPRFTLDVEMEDGTSETLCIGLENEMVGVSYAYVKSDGRIFAVDSNVNSAFVSSDEFIIPPDAEDAENDDSAEDEYLAA